MAYLQVLSDSGIAANSTDDLQAGIYSLLKALSTADTESYSGSTPLEAYAFVESRLRALGVNPWILARYLQTVQGRIAFHSSH